MIRRHPFKVGDLVKFKVDNDDFITALVVDVNVRSTKNMGFHYFYDIVHIGGSTHGSKGIWNECPGFGITFSNDFILVSSCKTT